MLRYYDRNRDPAAFAVPVARSGSLCALRGHKYAVLVTYRRNGEPVPSPIWFGLDGDRAFVRTGLDSWKVRRIRNNPHVVIAPSTRKGRPIGPGIPAVVRILPPEEHPRAIAARIAAYGLGRWIYDRTIAKVYGEAAYLEITATHPEPAADLAEG
ncbi:PPOX class F420-dependent oxidoreductase [Amycolatopsis arida]|nr:PPOX class F420-dependent oxidoreductase [Amycolatopsis arida]